MHLPKTDALAETLVTPDRSYPARTPHRYSQAGAQVLRRFQLLVTQLPNEPLGSSVARFYPDSPATAIYYFPGREQ